MVRFKYRYLTFILTFSDPTLVDDSLQAYDLERKIRAATEVHFGPLGLGRIQSNLSVRYFSNFTGIGVARVARDQIRYLWSTLSLMTTVNNRRCRIVVVNCSGTMRKAQEAAIVEDRRQLDALLARIERESGQDMKAIATPQVEKRAAQNVEQIQLMGE